MTDIEIMSGVAAQQAATTRNTLSQLDCARNNIITDSLGLWLGRPAAAFLPPPRKGLRTAIRFLRPSLACFHPVPVQMGV